VIAMLEQGATYSETAKALGLSYQQVYQRAMRAGIATQRSQERAAAAEAKARAQREQNRADRAQLRELLERDRRGELVPKRVDTYGHLLARFHDTLFRRHWEVVFELEEDAPLNRSESDALEHLGLLAHTLGRADLNAPLS
jgi:transposase-like protein